MILVVIPFLYVKLYQMLHFNIDSILNHFALSGAKQKALISSLVVAGVKSAT